MILLSVVSCRLSVPFRASARAGRARNAKRGEAALDCGGDRATALLSEPLAMEERSAADWIRTNGIEACRDPKAAARSLPQSKAASPLPVSNFAPSAETATNRPVR